MTRPVQRWNLLPLLFDVDVALMGGWLTKELVKKELMKIELMLKNRDDDDGGGLMVMVEMAMMVW